MQTWLSKDANVLPVLASLCFPDNGLRGVAGGDPACRTGYDGFILEP